MQQSELRLNTHPSSSPLQEIDSSPIQSSTITSSDLRTTMIRDKTSSTYKSGKRDSMESLVEKGVNMLNVPIGDFQNDKVLSKSIT